MKGSSEGHPPFTVASMSLEGFTRLSDLPSQTGHAPGDQRYHLKIAQFASLRLATPGGRHKLFQQNSHPCHGRWSWTSDLLSSASSWEVSAAFLPCSLAGGWQPAGCEIPCGTELILSLQTRSWTNLADLSHTLAGVRPRECTLQVVRSQWLPRHVLSQDSTSPTSRNILLSPSLRLCSENLCRRVDR